MTLFDLYEIAKTDRYTQDKHSAYKTGDIAQWKDGLHRKRNDGTWEKLQKREPTSKEKAMQKHLEKSLNEIQIHI